MEKQKLPIEEPLFYEEKKIIRRLTFKKAVEDFLMAFEVERGLIYSLKKLIINPGGLC